MELLRSARGLPSIVHRYTKIVLWPEPYAHALGRLKRLLGAAETKQLPFVVKFQIQKLVQNNYLPPAVVLGLIPTLEEIIERSGFEICVSAVRKLFPTIPYPAPDIEDSNFQLETLAETLKSNEDLCKAEGRSLDKAPQSNNVAIIHRAKVTPTHVFLYGPEQETTNRVLRKYADHHGHFLRGECFRELVLLPLLVCLKG